MQHGLQSSLYQKDFLQNQEPLQKALTLIKIFVNEKEKER